MVDRNIEEPLNLTSMEIDGQHARKSRRCHEIGDEFCRNRLAPTGLSILASIGIVRNNRCNRMRRRTLAGIG